MKLRWRLLAALLVSSGCNDGKVVQDQSLKLAGDWAASAVAQRPKSSPPATERVLYVDASLSMKGFAGCQDSPTEFNNILDRLTSDLGLVEVIRFGQAHGSDQASFDPVAMGRAVHCPAFFDRTQNPDYAVFEKARQSARTTTLYLTDGVQSDWIGSNPGPSLNSLKSWVQDGRALAILTMRSRFAGPAWSEQKQQMLSAVLVRDRPFYLFVLAPNEASVDDLLHRLSPSLLSTAKLIRFADQGVKCSLRMGQSVLKHAFTDNPPWAMVKQPELDKNAVLFSYACVLGDQYPLSEVRPRLSMSYRGWSGAQFATPVAKEFPLSAKPTAASTVNLSGTLPFDPLVRFGLYEIRAEADPGALKPWVAALSTDSDASESDFGRTYRFSWLVEQLARTHLARQPWSPFALTVQYR